MRVRDLLQGERVTRKLGSLQRGTNPTLADAIEHNICTVVELRRQAELKKTRQDRLADWITRFSGNMLFLYLHALWFGLWILVNVGTHPLVGFDPYPFGLLTMIVSLEAIFLSTFVLISQNKMGEVADARSDLDLQIDLLSEYEITRILRLVDAIADKMGIEEAADPELDELKTTTSPSELMQEMAARLAEARKL